MKPLASVRFTRNILIPAWIMAFGILFANSPAQGLALSAALFVVGLVVIPALTLIGVRARP